MLKLNLITSSYSKKNPCITMHGFCVDMFKGYYSLL